VNALCRRGTRGSSARERDGRRSNGSGGPAGTCATDAYGPRTRTPPQNARRACSVDTTVSRSAPLAADDGAMPRPLAGSRQPSRLHHAREVVYRGHPSARRPRHPGRPDPRSPRVLACMPAGAPASVAASHPVSSGGYRSPRPRAYRTQANDLLSSSTQGFGEACTWLGGLRMGGTGVAQDKQRAGLLLYKGCELRDGYACKTLGDFFATGGLGHPVLPKDPALAFTAFHMGCTTDARPNGEACSRMAEMLLQGDGCDRDQASKPHTTGTHACTRSDTRTYCSRQGWILVLPLQMHLTPSLWLGATRADQSGALLESRLPARGSGQLQACRSSGASAGCSCRGADCRGRSACCQYHSSGQTIIE
jgi:hypothetical protein